MVAVPTTWVPEHRNMETSLSWPTVDMWHEWEIWLIPSLKWPGWGNWGPKRTEIRPASQSWLPRGTEQQESTSGTPSSYLSFIHHWASCTFCKSLPLLTQSIFCFCKLTQRLNLTNHCLIFINCLLVHTLRTQFFQKVEGEGMGGVVWRGGVGKPCSIIYRIKANLIKYWQKVLNIANSCHPFLLQSRSPHSNWLHSIFLFDVWGHKTGSEQVTFKEAFCHCNN